jgi:hypothetical protein
MLEKTPPFSAGVYNVFFADGSNLPGDLAETIIWSSAEFCRIFTNM